MRIGVGSGNPVKRRAVERVVMSKADGETGANSEIEGVPAEPIVTSEPVPSGVPEQPRGHEETVAGAEQRAAAVLDAGGYDIGVGIEGGVAEFPGVNGTFLIMWAVVDDGERRGHGAGPSLRLPEAVARRIAAGAELGPVLDDRLDTTGIATRGGAASVLTGGQVTRTDALETAVAGAFGPFCTDQY